MNEPKRLSERQIIIRFAEVGGVPMQTIARAMETTIERVKTVCKQARDADLIGMIPPETPDDQTGAAAAELIYLRDRLDVLERENRELRGLSQSDDNITLRRDLGFTPSEALLIGLLSKHQHLSKIVAYDAMYGRKNDTDLPDPRIMDIYISKVRKKLIIYDVRIKTVYGDGWCMTPENKRRLKAVISEKQQSEAA